MIFKEFYFIYVAEITNVNLFSLCEEKSIILDPNLFF